MKTYEDFLDNYNDIPSFILVAINDYKASKEYNNALIGYDYYCRKNTTIRQFQKVLYEMTGEAVPDPYSANYKFANNFFQIFVKQEVSYLLGNGVTFNNANTKEKLGGAKFDNQLFRAAIIACWGTVSYSFYNYDHIDVFKPTEFVPLFGEEDGALHAGIRFWQLATNKPLRATLYEEDGYTDYKFNDGKAEIVNEKRSYITVKRISDATGEEILDGKNYDGFPIVPLWANEERQNELEGLREKIDGYDLISSGLANDITEAATIYWTIKNAGGMDDADLKKFIKHLKTVKAAVVDDDGSQAEAHTVDVPYQATETSLDILREGLYRDAMALDTDKLSAGNITATAIRAAYENLNLKCDAFEMLVTEYIKALLQLAGIEDDPTYKRSMIVNMQEDTQMILSAAQYLDDETILKHLPFLSPDEIKDVIKRKTEEEAERYEQQQAMLNQAIEAQNERDTGEEELSETVS